MKKGWVWPLIAMAGVSLLTVGLYWGFRGSQNATGAKTPAPIRGSGPQPRVDSDVPGVRERIPVRVVAAQKGDLTVTLPVFGAVTAVDKCDASYEDASAIIREVPVQVGDLVRRGQVVAVIDAAIHEAELQALQARLQQAQAMYDLAAWKYHALRQVHPKGGSSLHDLEEALANYKARQAELAQLEAEIRRVRTKLRQAVIRSPITGVVGKKNFFPGERVPLPSEKGIVTIYRIDEVYVEAEISEKDLTRLRPGLAANIFSDAYPGKVFQGVMEQLEPVLREQSRTILARVRVGNPDFLLKPGMFTRLEIILEKIPQVVMIPPQAIRLAPDRTTEVFVISDNVAFRRQVRIGITTASAAEVKSGLQPGELVVVEGGDQLRELDRVIAVPAQAAPPL